MLVHDLRGALHGVLGGVALLDAAEMPAALREQIARIGAAARTVVQLAEDLVGEEGPPGRRVTTSEVEVLRFLRHVDRRWTGEARERGRPLRVEAEADVPRFLRVDIVSLARAVGNLVGNALRHVRSGEVRLYARRTAEGGLAFEVTDDGPGFPPEVVARVLGAAAAPREETGDSDGHGLGLHIVGALCEEMGGVFTLDAGAGGGARARLSFPPALCGPDESAACAPDAITPDQATLAGLRVLLAEDNPTNQLVAVEMLRALDAEVETASDGVEALERFEAQDFDLAIVDIEMPRLSGLDVIRAIRARGDVRAATPIVALTAYALREHRERIAAAGANGLLAKPITSVAAFGAALRAHVAPARPAKPKDADVTLAQLDEPVADLQVFDALCAAIGSGMMAELLDKVVADLMQARADLAAALAPLDLKPIRSASHILISVAGAIGANRLQACARALNGAAHGGEERRLPAEVRRCLGEIDAAVAFAQSRRGDA